jgi:Uma2 family endonuclease
MSTAAKYRPHYTVSDYQQWPGDWELWDGYAIAMTPSPFGPHQAVLVALATKFRNEINKQACDATVVAELDWIVSEDTVVRPDVMVICGGPPERHLETAPALVAEILSPATRDNDLLYKRDLYAAEGVAHCLIVDPDAKSLKWLTLDSTGEFRPSAETNRPTGSICDDCEVSVEVESLFN